jgi:hypothetical protein
MANVDCLHASELMEKAEEKQRRRAEKKAPEWTDHPYRVMVRVLYV